MKLWGFCSFQRILRDPGCTFTINMFVNIYAADNITVIVLLSSSSHEHPKIMTTLELLRDLSLVILNNGCQPDQRADLNDTLEFILKT